MTPRADTPAPQASTLILIEFFVYLQVLDIISTLIGFSLGNPEGNPFIRMLIRMGPVAGLLWSKVFAVAVVVFCAWYRRLALIRWINYWFACLVVWNLFTVLRVLNS